MCVKGNALNPVTSQPVTGSMPIRLPTVSRPSTVHAVLPPTHDPFVDLLPVVGLIFVAVDALTPPSGGLNNI